MNFDRLPLPRSAALAYAAIAANFVLNSARGQNVDEFSPPLLPPIGLIAGAGVKTVILQPDGAMMVGGRFGGLSGSHSGIARLKSDGNRDEKFRGQLGTIFAESDPYVRSAALQSDGRLLIAGRWVYLNGKRTPTANESLARLNTDGSTDPSFVIQSPLSIHWTLAIQSDGKILAGGAGWFHADPGGGGSTDNLVRLNPDGSRDEAFRPRITNASDEALVETLALEPNGDILVGGIFTSVNGLPYSNLVRLKQDGSVDPGFRAEADGHVNAVVLTPDGKVLVGGAFHKLNGQVRTGFGRVNPDGSTDEAFDPRLDGSVITIALQTDGRIMVGGAFSSGAGLPAANLIRFTDDGTPDDGFSAPVTGTLPGLDFLFLDDVVPPVVLNLTQSKDGRILVGGSFLELAGEPRSCFGRLDNTGPAVERVEVTDATITWVRQGTGPEVERVTFEVAEPCGRWRMLGEGTRIPGGWQLQAGRLSSGRNVRARGQASNGVCHWIIETLSAVPGEPLVDLCLDSLDGVAEGAPFEFDILGPFGKTVVVEQSSDAIQWIPVATNLLSGAPVHFFDPTLRAKVGFYRARIIEEANLSSRPIRAQP